MTNLVEMPAAPASAPSQEMVTVTMTVTPAQAREWLDKMEIQRRLRRSVVDKLKRQVLAGRWKLMPHGIVLDRNGRPIDGQHRLNVVCELDRPLPFRVTFNADPSLLFAIDTTQAGKDLQDALKLDGAPTADLVELAGITRLVWRVEQGHSPLEVNSYPTNEEGLETWHRHPAMAEAARQAHRLKTIVPSRTLFGYFIFEAMKINADRVSEFVGKIRTGEMLRHGDPALLVRNTYLRDRSAGVTRSMTQQAIIAATSLNAALKGRHLASWRSVEFGKGKLPPIGA